jgi:hypothetical protein
MFGGSFSQKGRGHARRWNTKSLEHGRWPGGHPLSGAGPGYSEPVDTRVLIDSILRQTTVLVAQLSSAAGLRAPLAHVADEVFLSLSRELEQQGLSRKVVADMFGLALRGYQRRVQRLNESATDRGRTLWQAVLELLEKEEAVTRRRVFQRFQNDDAALVGAVLSDLTASGLIFRTGSGDDTVYGLTQERERLALARAGSLETIASLVWLEFCREPQASLSQVALRLALSEEQVETALRSLEAERRVRREDGRILAEPLTIPVGAQAGWEVAVLDHFRMVCVALATKLNRGKASADATDTTGGQTLTFEIDDQHPDRAEVLGLLARVRAETNALWQRVEDHNRASPKPDRQRVGFYLGQVELPKDDEA